MEIVFSIMGIMVLTIISVVFSILAYLVYKLYKKDITINIKVEKVNEQEDNYNYLDGTEAGGSYDLLRR